MEEKRRSNVYMMVDTGFVHRARASWVFSVANCELNVTFYPHSTSSGWQWCDKLTWSIYFSGETQTQLLSASSRPPASSQPSGWIQAFPAKRSAGECWLFYMIWTADLFLTVILTLQPCKLSGTRSLKASMVIAARSMMATYAIMKPTASEL